jgi:hypothetical protein
MSRIDFVGYATAACFAGLRMNGAGEHDARGCY